MAGSEPLIAALPITTRDFRVTVPRTVASGYTSAEAQETLIRTQAKEETRWQPVGPFRSFADLQKAVSDRKASLGVDPLAAAEWADAHMSRPRKLLIAALSILLISSAIASVVGAAWFRNYWLLAAIPIQALVFYLSQPAFKFQRWATIGSGASIFALIELLLNGYITASTLTAYAGLTFAAVRASGFVTASAFRKALIKDQELFIAVFRARACSVRESESKKVYEFRPHSK